MKNENKILELNNNNNSLNLLRLVFASFVLIGHSFGFIQSENNLPNCINYLISLAVPMFFVVSGYLITASAIKNDLKTFFRKRFARLYPAYFTCLVLVVVLFAPVSFTLIHGHFSLTSYLNQDPSPVRYLIFNLPLFLISPSIGGTLTNIPGNYWNGSAWTLIFEFGCYVAIAVIIYLLSKFKLNKLKFITATYLVLIIISLFYPRPEGIPSRSILNLFIFAVNLFSIFLGGSIVYLIKDHIVFSLKYLIVSLMFCIFIMSFLPYGWATEISAIPLTYIILFVSLKLKSPDFIRSNDISYGVYIYA